MERKSGDGTGDGAGERWRPKPRDTKHLIAVGSEEADLTDDEDVSITGDMGNSCAGERP